VNASSGKIYYTTGGGANKKPENFVEMNVVGSAVADTSQDGKPQVESYCALELYKVWIRKQLQKIPASIFYLMENVIYSITKNIFL
jgi:hypothetical protein